MTDDLDLELTMKPTTKKIDDLDLESTMRPDRLSEMQDRIDTDQSGTIDTNSVSNTTSTSTELKRGDVLDGKYHVIKKIGQGGMGAIYRVIDDATDVEYAVKVVLPEYVDTPDALKELQREVAKAQLCVHQNLLNYKFFADSGPIKYIVMELVDGEDLEEYRLRKGGRLPEEEVKRIALEIISGLEYFHEKGLVHLDLKPKNILLSKTGEVKISDYGISKSIREQIDTQHLSSEMSAGTLCFMAPEQLNGSLCDRRTDLYALGLLLYQLLQGEFPFELKSKEGIIAWHLDEKHLCPRTSSALLDPIIEKCTQNTPRDRYLNGNEILAALKTGKENELSQRKQEENWQDSDVFRRWKEETENKSDEKPFDDNYFAGMTRESAIARIAELKKQRLPTGFMGWHNEKFGDFLHRRGRFENRFAILPHFLYRFIALTAMFFVWYFYGFIWIPIWYIKSNYNDSEETLAHNYKIDREIYEIERRFNLESDADKQSRKEKKKYRFHAIRYAMFGGWFGGQKLYIKSYGWWIVFMAFVILSGGIGLFFTIPIGLYDAYKYWLMDENEFYEKYGPGTASMFRW